MAEIIKLKNISEFIYSIHGEKVMLDFDLAKLYEIENRALKQQVRRNMDRFPEDFMFQLTASEWKELITNCDKLKKYKNSPITPFAFTEQGVAMLSSVLKSQKAVQVNIAIMRTFIELRKFAIKNEDLSKKLKKIEKETNLKFLQYDEQFQLVMEIIQQFDNSENEDDNERKIGFTTD